MNVPEITLFAALGAYFIGGIAKGALGIGLTMLAIPALSTFMPIRDAVAISFFPMIFTNFWQMIHSEHLLTALRRFWLLLIVLIVSTWAGTLALVHLSPSKISILLGFIVLAFTIYSLVHPRVVVGPRYETAACVGAGVIGGFFGGMALISGPPIIILLLALNLKKEEFIGAMGLLYFVGFLPAGALLIWYGILNTGHIFPGMLSLIPVFGGLMIGERLRGHIDQVLFRKILLFVLLAIGINLVRKGMF